MPPGIINSRKNMRRWNHKIKKSWHYLTKYSIQSLWASFPCHCSIFPSMTIISSQTSPAMKSATRSDQDQLKLTSIVQGAEGRLHLVKDSVPPRTQSKWQQYVCDGLMERWICLVFAIFGKSQEKVYGKDNLILSHTAIYSFHLINAWNIILTEALMSNVLGRSLQLSQ